MADQNFDNLHTVGERIKAIRMKHNLTQIEFGKLIGVSGATISTTESGKTNPEPRTLILICEKFGISQQWLETGEGERLRMQQSAMLIPQLHSILAGHPLLADALNAAISVMREEDFRRLEEVIDQAVAVYTQKKEQP